MPIVTLLCPLSTLTEPIAMVPSWHDRHSLELPPGDAAMSLASIEFDVYGV